MEYLYLMDKTIYKMSHGILYKMWVVDFYSYVPLFTLSVTKMFLLIKGIKYTQIHAFHAMGICVCTKIGNQN